MKIWAVRTAWKSGHDIIGTLGNCTVKGWRRVWKETGQGKFVVPTC